MNRMLRGIGVTAAIAVLGAGLYVLRAAPDAPELTGATAAAGAAAPVPAPAPATAVAAPSATPATPDATPVIPAIASDAERAATRDQRAEALPVFLAAADRQIAAARDALAALQRRGAGDAEIRAQEATLQRLLDVREQVLARNADLAARR